MKHEIIRESFPIALNSLIQNTSFNSIKLRKIAVQHHLVSSKEEDAALNLLRWEILVTRPGTHEEN